MPTRPAATADDISDSISKLIDRVADAKVTQEMARRGQSVAGILAERGAEVGDRAFEAWRDSESLRRDAAKTVSRAGNDAVKWSDHTWRSSLRPLFRDLWKKRTVAMGAAGAAVPVGRELVDTAAERLGLRERTERRHWGAFFFGLLLGAIGGAVVAMLTTPKRGSEIRRELGARADEVREEITTRARDAEWVPMFQREDHTNGGGATADANGSISEAAAEAGDRADQAADETAEAINEAYDSVDRETTG